MVAAGGWSAAGHAAGPELLPEPELLPLLLPELELPPLLLLELELLLPIPLLLPFPPQDGGSQPQLLPLALLPPPEEEGPVLSLAMRQV